MRSSGRNSRKPYRVLGFAAAASLLLGSAAQADDAAHNFVLTAYSNGRGGEALMKGDFDAAVKQLRYRAPTAVSLEPGTTSNNRCVALTMTKQWQSAKPACDEAVRDAEDERLSLSTYNMWARKIEKDAVAVALSNRAVLHWMSDDAAAAASDLKKAAYLSPDSDFVSRNRAALQFSHPAVAQIIVTQH
jgi:hypothetical protein